MDFTSSSLGRRWIRTLVTGVCVAALSTEAGAQPTAAGIIGQVRDESGAVLPGVSVAATSPALQVPEVLAVTDAAGEYRITPLPIGTYTLVYTITGFRTIRRENVRLTVGFVAQINVDMPIGAVEESITVSGASPIVDVNSTGTATQLTRDTLDVIPTSRSGIISLLAQGAGRPRTLGVGGVL